MQIIIWRVNQKNSLFFLTGALFTVLLSHLCCIASALLPLGLNGLTVFLEKTLGELQPWLSVLPGILLIFSGWRIYGNPKSHLIEKVLFWISALIVAGMLYLQKQ
ncbi:hypothetical protein Tfer_2405 [Thermincola ferriacetica]|uniref:Uncharacterized protein n=1 Tax=Thermincola ferriacetica TaxID=281456 RepID=A0A0L6W035_9FIRM|nr:hypothetical protein [Thermincola ferriacetica]KNZ68917.1 hypothetical protein Tfer_2405 [Thermincola ferriacetica]